MGTLKVNTDGSSKGNPGLDGVGGVGRDSSGSVVFLFSIHKGTQTINLMEGWAILHALERAFELGWRRVICESDSQVLVNLLNKGRMSDVNWQLAVLVQQILQIGNLMEKVSFVHIPREWNRAADCLAKWASEHLEDWKIEDWAQLPQELGPDLERVLAEDKRGIE